MSKCHRFVDYSITTCIRISFDEVLICPWSWMTFIDWLLPDAFDINALLVCHYCWICCSIATSVTLWTAPLVLCYCRWFINFRARIPQRCTWIKYHSSFCSLLKYVHNKCNLEYNLSCIILKTLKSNLVFFRFTFWLLDCVDQCICNFMTVNYWLIPWKEHLINPCYFVQLGSCDVVCLCFI